MYTQRVGNVRKRVIVYYVSFEREGVGFVNFGRQVLKVFVLKLFRPV